MASFNALRKSDFTAKTNVTQPEPEFSTILYKRVPRSQAWLLPHNKPLRMQFVTQESHTPNANGNYTFQLTGDMMDLPHLNDNDVVKVWDVDASKYLTITDVDYENNEVTVSDATNGNACLVFYPFTRGTIRIVLRAPQAMGDASGPIFNRSVRDIHGVDQGLATSPLLIREAPRQAGGLFGGWVLPETWQLQFLLKSDVTISNHERAVNYRIWFPYRFAPVGQMPRGYETGVLESLIQLGGR